MAVSFIGGGNQSTQRKPSTCRKSLTTLSQNVVSIYNRDCCLHLYWQRKHYCRKNLSIINLSILTNRKIINYSWFSWTSLLPNLLGIIDKPLDYLPCLLVQIVLLHGITDNHWITSPLVVFLYIFFTWNYRQLLDYLPCLLVQSFFVHGIIDKALDYLPCLLVQDFPM